MRAPVQLSMGYCVPETCFQLVDQDLKHASVPFERLLSQHLTFISQHAGLAREPWPNPDVARGARCQTVRASSMKEKAMDAPWDANGRIMSGSLAIPMTTAQGDICPLCTREVLHDGLCSNGLCPRSGLVSGSTGLLDDGENCPETPR